MKLPLIQAHFQLFLFLLCARREPHLRVFKLEHIYPAVFMTCVEFVLLLTRHPSTANKQEIAH